MRPMWYGMWLERRLEAREAGMVCRVGEELQRDAAKQGKRDRRVLFGVEEFDAGIEGGRGGAGGDAGEQRVCGRNGEKRCLTPFRGDQLFDRNAARSSAFRKCCSCSTFPCASRTSTVGIT